MPTIKLTSKRQATLPKEVCDQLGVNEGDQIALEPRVIGGETVWILRPRSVDWSWIGSVKVPANASHDMDDVRASVAKGRRESGE
jgi:bifunctional DNA-binding transcriptional regulator/antitoxin component of YhaV-PrlF toxin-antitoxin module